MSVPTTSGRRHVRSNGEDMMMRSTFSEHSIVRRASFRVWVLAAPGALAAVLFCVIGWRFGVDYVVRQTARARFALEAAPLGSYEMTEEMTVYNNVLDRFDFTLVDDVHMPCGTDGIRMKGRSSLGTVCIRFKHGLVDVRYDPPPPKGVLGCPPAALARF